MTTRNIIDKAITRDKSSVYGLLVGRIVTVNLETNTCVITVERSGTTRLYADVPLPSNGLGIRTGGAKVNQLVILGFIEGNNSSPVVVTLIDNNGLSLESAEDSSDIYMVGPLSIGQLL